MFDDPRRAKEEIPPVLILLLRSNRPVLDREVEQEIVAAWEGACNKMLAEWLVHRIKNFNGTLLRAISNTRPLF